MLRGFAPQAHIGANMQLRRAYSLGLVKGPKRGRPRIRIRRREPVVAPKDAGPVGQLEFLEARVQKAPVAQTASQTHEPRSAGLLDGYHTGQMQQKMGFDAHLMALRCLSGVSLHGITAYYGQHWGSDASRVVPVHDWDLGPYEPTPRNHSEDATRVEEEAGAVWLEFERRVSGIPGDGSFGLLSDVSQCRAPGIDSAAKVSSDAQEAGERWTEVAPHRLSISKRSDCTAQEAENAG